MTLNLHRHWPRLLLLLALAGLGAWLWQAWPGLRFELARLQLGFQRELGQLLRHAQNREPATVLALLGLSFAYGVCHAAGPGHGKLVLSTYLATHPSRLGQAIRLSVGAALLQALVAISLIGLGGWLLESVGPSGPRRGCRPGESQLSAGGGVRMLDCLARPTQPVAP